jgi:hypothetical protein
LHRQAGASRTLDGIARALLAALLSALFLGGSQCGFDLQPLAAAVGGVLLACKALAVFALLHGVTRRPAPVLLRPLRWLAVALLPLTASVWLWLAPSHAQELGVGVAAAITLCLVAALALVERVSLQRRPLELRTRISPAAH